MELHFRLSIVTLLLFTSCKAMPPIDPTDPVQVDPKHYTVAFENDQIRLLHSTYGPHEKSPMHSHPEFVVIQLSAAQVRETNAEGKTSESTGTPGVGSGPPTRHALENLGDTPFESYIIEFKKAK